MDRAAMIAELTTESHPRTFVEGARRRCNWIVRASSLLPNQSSLAELQQLIEERVSRNIKIAYGSVATARQLDDVRPTLLLMRIDDYHLLVRIVFAGPELSIGDSAVISEWGTLQAVAKEIEIDDLQGLPRDFWFLLRELRDSQST
jgi:hypothetical protein